ncbi:hypothetical protein A2U01_0078695 [Trifolium medium]|uniref:Uncharacterized protein n=1 Tax=Trifolium medium TaxID=97028 RepID=A0A392TA76_9FABA|nr:hypothetical protein [Trifolium medium]
MQEDLGALQLSMTPVEDEPEAARGLTTRAELVEKIWVLGQDMLVASSMDLIMPWISLRSSILPPSSIPKGLAC